MNFDAAAEIRILVVDDDAELGELVKRFFSSRGFQIDLEEDGQSGLERAQNGDYALLVLDVNLPSLEGFEVLRRLRSGSSKTKSLPVVMLTAHGDETDRIVGLELGADDYLPKPFNPRELLARIQAVLRRTGSPLENELEAKIDSQQLTVNSLEIDVPARQVTRDGEEIDLTAAEFDVFLVLAQQSGRVVTKDDLAREALKRRLLPMDRSLDMHISNLRAKLWPSGGGLEFLKTVRGVGYLLKKSN